MGPLRFSKGELEVTFRDLSQWLRHKFLNNATFGGGTSVSCNNHNLMLDLSVFSLKLMRN